MAEVFHEYQLYSPILHVGGGNRRTMKLFEKLKDGLFSKAVRPNFFKLCKFITADEYYKHTLLTVTLALIQGHNLGVNFK